MICQNVKFRMEFIIFSSAKNEGSVTNVCQISRDVFNVILDDKTYFFSNSYKKSFRIL